MPIDFRMQLARIGPIIVLFRECTPRILVVTDNLNFNPASDFGLTEFVDTLKASTIHGMTPEVITAAHDPNPATPIVFNAASNHLSGFKFDDATHGLLKSRYDVAFLFGINSKGVGDVPPGGLEAIGRFMQAGGGLFATGDHEDLGAAISSDIPRVRKMRFWLAAETPDIADDTRLSTNLPGANSIYEFDDQADKFPQRLYVNYRTAAGGIGNAHPLLQIPAATRAIEVFPDHPHEGECRIPDDLTTTFSLSGASVQEWPKAISGSDLAPEVVAVTMSHGDSFPGKAALFPRSFIAIAAYDGQAANVGRVATDATWHHFVNVNIQRTSPPAPAGLTGLTGLDLSDVKQYFVNLATWLMPKNVRLCLRIPLFLAEVQRYPLFEELVLPDLSRASGAELRAVGEQFEAALALRMTQAEIRELIHDALEDGMGVQAAAKLRAQGEQFGRISARDAGLAALGGLAVGTLERLPEIAEKTRIDPHAMFEPVAKEATALAVKRFMNEARQELRQLDTLIASLER